MLSQWVSRAWGLLKAAPIVLFAILAALIAIQSARRATGKAVQAARIGDPQLDGPAATPRERARQLDRQLDSMREVMVHTQAAKRAKRVADVAASRIETAGQPSLAEIVRSWNRE